MPACPACGSEVAPPAIECPRCHLAVALFDAVREAVGVEQSDPRYSSEVQELLKAVDTGQVPEESPDSARPAVLAFPARFPAPEAPRAETPEAPAPPSLDGLPALPALPGGGLTGLRRQIEGYQQLARSMGIDLSELLERNREAVAVDDRPTLERLSRELFVRIAAILAEEYEATIARRNRIAGLVRTSNEDDELRTLRSALLAGDLAGSYQRLAQVRERLAGLEERHETLLILLAEGELLADTIRELGGDPGPALGPLEEGRRLLREGESAGAEAVLARASVALWAVLYPRLGPELHRLKEGMVERRTAGEDVSAEVETLRQLAENLKHRNFASAIGNYRKLRGQAPPAGTPAPAAREPPAPSPSPTSAPS